MTTNKISSLVTRTDGMGWDAHVKTEHGHTVRSIIKTETNFLVINPFKLENYKLEFATYDEAVQAAENLLI